MCYRSAMDKCKIILSARIHRELDMNWIERKTFNATFYRLLNVPKKKIKVDKLEPVLDNIIEKFKIENVNTRLLDRRRIGKGNQGRYNV